MVMITLGELVLNPGQAATSSLVSRSGTFRAVHGMARGRSVSRNRLPPGGIWAGVDSGHGRRLMVSRPGRSRQGGRSLVAVRKRRPRLRRLDLDDVIAHRPQQAGQLVLLCLRDMELIERGPQMLHGDLELTGRVRPGPAGGRAGGIGDAGALLGGLAVAAGERYGRRVKQHVRFCSAADGVRLAYAVHGSGPPLVRVATWLSHLELDWDSPVWRHWLKGLGERHTFVRYDERGCGLSDTEIGDPSVEAWVGDLETVVDAVGLERFALLGVSQGAAIAVTYAARHPERISDLVLYGGYARGRRLRGQREQEAALVAAIRAGWATEDPAFRHVFSMLFLPHGTPAQLAWYDELLRTTTSADAAVRLFKARGAVDVAVTAPRVGARTLVIHARGDRVVPVEEGRLLAALIPGARLVVLDSVNHILLSGEPAWEQF